MMLPRHRKQLGVVVQLLVATVGLFATVFCICPYTQTGTSMIGAQGGGCSVVTLSSMSIGAGDIAGFNLSLISAIDRPTDIALVLRGVSLLSKSVVFVAGFPSATVIPDTIRYCNVTVSEVTGSGATLIQGAFPTGCNITITSAVLSSTAATDLSSLGIGRPSVAKSLVFQNVYLQSALITVSDSQLRPSKSSSAAIFIDGVLDISSSAMRFQNVLLDAALGVDMSTTSALSGVDRFVVTQCDGNSVVMWSNMTVSASVAGFAMDSATLQMCTVSFSGGQWSSGGSSAGYTVYLVGLTMNHASILWQSCTLSDSHAVVSQLVYWGSFSIVQAATLGFYDTTWTSSNGYGLYVATDLFIAHGSSVVLQRLVASPTNQITVFIGGALVVRNRSTFVIDSSTLRSSNGLTMKIVGAANVTNHSSLAWTSSSLGSALGAVLMAGGVLIEHDSYWYLWNCTVVCNNGDGIQMDLAFTVSNRSVLWFDNNTIQVNYRGLRFAGDVTWVRSFSSLILTDTIMKSNNEDLVWAKRIQISSSSWVHIRGTQGIVASSGKGLLRVNEAVWEATGTLSLSDNYMTAPVGTDIIAFILDAEGPIASFVYLRCNYLRSVLISPASAYSANVLVVDGTTVIVLNCGELVPAGSQCFPNLTRFADAKRGGCSCLPGAFTELCLPVNIRGSPAARRYSPTPTGSISTLGTHSTTTSLSLTRAAASQSQSFSGPVRTSTASSSRNPSATYSATTTRATLSLGPASRTDTDTAPVNSATASVTQTRLSKSPTPSTIVSTTRHTHSTEASISPTYYRIKTRTSTWVVSESKATPTSTKRVVSVSLSAPPSISQASVSVSVTRTLGTGSVSTSGRKGSASASASSTASCPSPSSTPTSSMVTYSPLASPSSTRSLQPCLSQMFFLVPSTPSRLTGLANVTSATTSLTVPVIVSGSANVSATLGDLVTWGIQRSFSTSSPSNSSVPTALVSFAIVSHTNDTTSVPRSGEAPTLLCDVAVARLVTPTTAAVEENHDSALAANVSVSVACATTATQSALQLPPTQEQRVGGCSCNTTLWGSGLPKVLVAVDVVVPYGTWCGLAPPVNGSLTVHLESDNFGPLAVPTTSTPSIPVARAAQTVASVASVVSMGSISPITASNIARITALQRLVVCRVTADKNNEDDESAPVGVFPLSFGPTSHAASRGSLVSNMALLVGFTLGVGALALVLLSGIGGMRRTLALAVVHWHSVVLVPLLGVMQPTTTCAVILFASGGSSWAGDVPLASVWVAGACVGIGWIWVTVRGKRFPCALQPLPRRPTVAGGESANGVLGKGSVPGTLKGRTGLSTLVGNAVATWKRISRYALRGTEHWTVVDESLPLWKKQYFLLIAELRLPWYLPLDLSFSAIIGVIAGIPSSSTSVCVGQVTCVVLVYLILVIVCVTQRPFLQPFMFYYTVSVNVLGCVAAVLLCLAVANGDPDRRLETGVATLALIVSGMSMTKSFVDATELIAALRRMRTKWMRARTAASSVGRQTTRVTTVADLLGDHGDTGVSEQRSLPVDTRAAATQPLSQQEGIRGGVIPVVARLDSQSEIDFNFVAQWSDQDDASDDANEQHQHEMATFDPVSSQSSSGSVAQVYASQSLPWGEPSSFALNDEVGDMSAINDLELAYQQFRSLP